MGRCLHLTSRSETPSFRWFVVFTSSLSLSLSLGFSLLKRRRRRETVLWCSPLIPFPRMSKMTTATPVHGFEFENIKGARNLPSVEEALLHFFFLFDSIDYFEIIHEFLNALHLTLTRRRMNKIEGKWKRRLLDLWIWKKVEEDERDDDRGK